MSRAEDWDARQRTDVKGAFSRAFAEIKVAQDGLRAINPESPLLDLVTLIDDPFPTQRGMNFNGFGDWARDEARKRNGFLNPELLTRSWYYGLGLYVDALEVEAQRLGV